MDNCDQKWDEETGRAAVCRKCNVTDLELDAIAQSESRVQNLEDQLNEAKNRIKELEIFKS